MWWQPFAGEVPFDDSEQRRLIVLAGGSERGEVAAGDDEAEAATFATPTMQPEAARGAMSHLQPK